VADLQAGELIINEVMVDPSECGDAQGEYAELLYTGPGTVDLGGLLVADNGSPFSVPAGTLLSTGEFLILAADASAFESACYGSPAATAISTGLSFDNTDLLQILKPAGLLDILEWGGATGLNVTSGVSFELSEDLSGYCDADTPIGVSFDFGSPGTANGLCDFPDTDTDDSDADTDDTDLVCEIPDLAYNPPTPGAAIATEVVFWQPSVEATVLSGLFDDYGFDDGTTPQRFPESFIVELLDVNQDPLCIIFYTITQQTSVDPTTWPNAGAGDIYMAVDFAADPTSAFTNCPASMTAREGGSAGTTTTTIDPLNYFSGLWRYGLGTLTDNRATMQGIVGAAWATDWDPYVMGIYLGSPTSATEYGYTFLYEQQCQDVEVTAGGQITATQLNAPTSAPWPDSFVSTRSLFVYFF